MPFQLRTPLAASPSTYPTPVPRPFTIETIERRVFLSATIVYAHQFGDVTAPAGTSASWVAVDAAGNSYLTGIFSGSVDFDPSPNKAFKLTSASGKSSTFVAKYAPNGSFLWAVQTTGANNAGANGIAVNKDGSIWVGGDFTGTVDFNPGKPTFQLKAKGASDIFLWKLSSAGKFISAVSAGGVAGSPGLFSIAVDASGDVYASGYFTGTAVFGSTKIKSHGLYDAFVTKVSSAGKFVFTRSFGGPQQESGGGIAVDKSGNVYMTGLFTGTFNFNPGGAGGRLVGLGGQDAFVLKLDSAGHFKFVRKLGSPTTNTAFATDGYAIAVDASGNIFTTGAFTGTADFNPGTGVHNLTSAGSSDVYVSKLNSGGNFVWAARMGGSGIDGVHAITTDKAGNVYLAGQYTSTVDFDPGPGTFNLVGTPSPVASGFVWKLSAAGKFGFAKSFTADANSFAEANGIAIDPKGNIYASGRFEGNVDLDPGPNHTALASGNRFELAGILVKIKP